MCFMQRFGSSFKSWYLFQVLHTSLYIKDLFSCISHKFDLPFLHYILESNFYNSSIVNASSSYESESADISVSPSNISIIENEDEGKLKSKLTNLITLIIFLLLILPKF